MTSDIKKKIDIKCREIEQFFNASQDMEVKKINGKKMELEIIVESILHRLQHNQEVDKKKNDEYVKLLKYISYLRKPEEGQKPGNFTFQYMDDIKSACDETEQWLKSNYNSVSVEIIKSRYTEFQYCVDKIKRRYEEFEMKERDKEVKRAEVYSSFKKFTRKVIKYTNSEKGKNDIDDEYLRNMEHQCVETTNWIEKNYHVISPRKMNSEELKLRTKITEILRGLKASQEMFTAEMQLRNQEYKKLMDYIENILDFVATKKGNDNITNEYLLKINQRCTVTRELLEKYGDKLTRNEITVKADQLELKINEIWTKMQERKQIATDEEKRCREAYDKLTTYINGMIKYIDSERENDCISVQYSEKVKRQNLEWKKWLDTNYNYLTSDEIFSEKSRLESENSKVLIDIKARKKAEMAEKLAKIKNKTAINNFMKCISDVESCRYFYPYELNASDKKEIEEKCKYWKQWLSESSKYFSSDHIEASQIELEDFAQIIFNRLGERQQLEVRKQRQKQLKEAAKNLETYIEDVKQFLWSDKYKDLISREYKNWIYDVCNRADRIASSYKSYGLSDIVSSHEELQESVSKLCDELDRKKRLLVAERRKRQEAEEKVYDYIKYVRSVLTSNDYFMRKVPPAVTYCEKVEKYLHFERATLSVERIEEMHKNISAAFQNDCRKLNIKFQRTTVTKYIPQNHEHIKQNKSIKKVRKFTDKMRERIRNERAMSISEKEKLLKLCQSNDEWCTKRPNATKHEADRRIEILQGQWDHVIHSLQIRAEAVDRRQSANFGYFSYSGSRKQPPTSRYKYHSEYSPSEYKGNVKSGSKKSISTGKDSSYGQSQYSSEKGTGKSGSRQSHSRESSQAKTSTYDESRCLSEKDTGKSRSKRSNSEESSPKKDSSYGQSRYSREEPKSSKKELIALAKEARSKIHDPMYNEEVSKRDKNEIIHKEKKIINGVWTNRTAEKELQDLKTFCKDIFGSIDYNADPKRKDTRRRWYY
ncbi:uncharacterized protein LOC144420993 [Styela clava]